jgi:hypothetical protein
VLSEQRHPVPLERRLALPRLEADRYAAAARSVLSPECRRRPAVRRDAAAGFRQAASLQARSGFAAGAQALRPVPAWSRPRAAAPAMAVASGKKKVAG